MEWPWHQLYRCRSYAKTAPWIPTLPEHQSSSMWLLLQSGNWLALHPREIEPEGLWEAAVKSFKTHLTRIVGNSKLNFEEMSTVLAQIEACLNSHPLGTITHNGIEMLTPRHFLWHPLQAIPDHPQSFQKQNLLQRYLYRETFLGEMEEWTSHCPSKMFQMETT